MANKKDLTYKRVQTTTLKATGILDSDNGTIEVDGEDKNILSLLSDFNGVGVVLTVQAKSECDLGEPTADSE